MSITFQIAEIIDLGPICNLHEEQYGRNADADVVEKQISNGTSFVVKDEDNVIGFLLTKPVKPKTIEITDLLIRSQSRGIGIGSRFIDWCENQLSANYKKILLTNFADMQTDLNNTQAHNFYLNNGYGVAESNRNSTTYKKELKL